MEFRSSEYLFSRINKFLSGFGSNGQLDENDWYYYVKEVLMRLNVPSSSLAETVLEINNYKATLPDDFYQLWSVWSGFQETIHSEGRKANFQNRLVFYYEDTCLEKGKCSVSSLQPTDTHIIQRDVFIDEEFSHTEKYKHVQLMKLVNASSELCHNECFNKRVNSPYTFSIAGTHLKFNEANGHVLLQYFAFKKDEDGLPLIPNDVRIEDALDAYIKYKELQKMFINGTEDVLTRMQYMEQQALIKMKEAKYHLHLPTWESMMQLAYKKKDDVARFLIPEVRVPSAGWWYSPFGSRKTIPTGSIDKNFSTWK